MASPPLPPVQMIASHIPLVLHDHIEVTLPLAIIPVSATNDMHACMDRLEHFF